MKKQLSVKGICDEIRSIYFKTERHQDDIIKIMRLVFQLNDAYKNEKLSEGNLQYLLDTELLIANSKGSIKHLTEKELLRYIAYFPHRLYEGNNIKFLPPIEKAQKKEKVVFQFIEFAKKLLVIKIPRESFSGTRKGYAIDLLGNLAEYFEFPEFMELAKKSLKQKSKNQFFDTIQALEMYYKKREIDVDEEIIDLVDKRFAKAKTRSEAVGCLSFQVNTGVISEFGALSRIDEWKEKNEIW